MKVSATKVVEQPQTVIDQQRQVSGTMPPPPPDLPVDLPILVVVLLPEEPAPAAAPAPVAVASATLPQTGSQLPLLGILGALALLSGLGLRVARLRP